MASKKIEYRTEQDYLGQMPVPVMAYWGVRTARALEFGRSESMNTRFRDSLVMLRKAAVETNMQIGRVEARQGKAVSLAADEILTGQWHDQFPISILQAGSLGAVCANVDEVLANRAAEMLGGNIGDYQVVSTDNHVAAGQTPYDSFPTALRVALLAQKSDLEACLLDLERLLRRKALELDKVIKPGRVHLRDAMPVSLGQVFNSWGSSVGRCCKRLADITPVLAEASPGTGEVGTGYGTTREFSAMVVDKLSEISGFKLRLCDDPIRAHQSMSDFVSLSSILKEIAVELQKISSDLCLMSSGPSAGFGELELPPAQLEKTPFPGQDRAIPIVPEFASMLCLQVLGNDMAVCAAARTGQLEYNSMLPLIAHCLLASLDSLTDAINMLAKRCISGVNADASRCQQNVTATGVDKILLSGFLGAEQAKALESEAQERNISIRDLILERQLMTPDQIIKCMNVKTLLSPGSNESSRSRI